MSKRVGAWHGHGPRTRHGHGPRTRHGDQWGAWKIPELCIGGAAGTKVRGHTGVGHVKCSSREKHLYEPHSAAC